MKRKNKTRTPCHPEIVQLTVDGIQLFCRGLGPDPLYMARVQSLTPERRVQYLSLTKAVQERASVLPAELSRHELPGYLESLKNVVGPCEASFTQQVECLSALQVVQWDRLQDERRANLKMMKADFSDQLYAQLIKTPDGRKKLKRMLRDAAEGEEQP